MLLESEALRILQENQIPFHQGRNGIPALMHKTEINVERLRTLGFRISHHIEGQLVVSFRGNRFGLIV
jgi:hypothetical protein